MRVAVIAESYERIHRSNLVGMGIIPLQFAEGHTADSYGLTGRESYSINIPNDVKPGQMITVEVRIIYVLPAFFSHLLLLNFFVC